MPSTISSGHLAKWKNKVASLEARVKSARSLSTKKMEELADTGIHTATTVGTAMALGVLDGKTGGLDVKGVPVSLLTGLAGHGLGLVTGKSALHGVGDGALAAFAYASGRSIGIDMGKKSKSEVKGDDKGNAQLTAEEIAALT